MSYLEGVADADIVLREDLPDDLVERRSKLIRDTVAACEEKDRLEYEWYMFGLAVGSLEVVTVH
jgi:hypothetical protein